jgi:hypothetical protein
MRIASHNCAHALRQMNNTPRLSLGGSVSLGSFNLGILLDAPKTSVGGGFTPKMGSILLRDTFDSNGFMGMAAQLTSPAPVTKNEVRWLAASRWLHHQLGYSWLSLMLLLIACAGGGTGLPRRQPHPQQQLAQ